jgi:hypothetical protein
VRAQTARILFGVALAAMLALTWRGWTDPVIDFGRELYVPWQLSEGQVLYRDLAYHNGPFSPYLNAAWFSVAGVSLASLLFLNFLVIVLVVCSLHRFVEDAIGRRAGVVAALSFISIFAFGQYTRFANYNWMSPYSHEVTHGIALCLVSLWGVRAYARTGRIAFAAVAGVALGIVFLTKAEVFIAGAAATFAGLAAALWVRRTTSDPRKTAAIVAITLFGGLIGPLIAFVLLGLSMPAGEALRGTLGTWVYIFDARSVSEQFFLSNAGLEDLPGSLGLMGRSLAAWILCLLPAGVLAWLAPAKYKTQAVVGVLGLYAPAMLIVFLRRGLPTDEWLRPLPLWIGLAFVAVGWRVVRRSGLAADERGAVGSAMRVGLITLAGVLLLKVLLAVRSGHYGFGLTMPGAALALAWFVIGLPRWFSERGRRAPVVTCACLLLWLGSIASHLAITHEIRRLKSVRVGEGPDAFYAMPDRGALVEGARRWLENNTKPDSTLTTFIDREMLNYLTRRRNPIRFGDFNPQQLQIYGEETMRVALVEHPPDFIALIHRDTTEYGYQYFGRDYGTGLAQWIATHYDPVARIGAVPFRSARNGIAFYRRLP